MAVFWKIHLHGRNGPGGNLACGDSNPESFGTDTLEEVTCERCQKTRWYAERQGGAEAAPHIPYTVPKSTTITPLY